MTSAELSALLVLATVSSFTPGPNTTLSTAMAANHGLRRAMPFVCAVPVGWGMLLSLCALGLGALVLSRGQTSLGRAVAPVAVIQAALVSIAFACLVAVFVRSDMSVLLVAANSHSAKPMIYKIAGISLSDAKIGRAHV